MIFLLIIFENISVLSIIESLEYFPYKHLIDHLLGVLAEELSWGFSIATKVFVDKEYL